METIDIDTELVLPMYNVHPYVSLRHLGKKVCIIHSKIQYLAWEGTRGAA